jgi:serine/threonine protein kinase
VAHAQGFIHRDIKPKNIMLVANSAAAGGGMLIKQTDIGIVRVAEEAGLTNSGIVLGTADYHSPEQARGETLTASSDLYSLGVVMFEMLTGRPPFVGPTAVSIAMQHASANPPPVRQFNPTIPPAVEQVVIQALQKEPADRFHSAAEMQQTLRNCARELARARPATTSTPAQAYPRNYASGADGPGYLPPSGRR